MLLRCLILNVYMLAPRGNSGAIGLRVTRRSAGRTRLLLSPTRGLLRVALPLAEARGRKVLAA